MSFYSLSPLNLTTASSFLFFEHARSMPPLELGFCSSICWWHLSPDLCKSRLLPTIRVLAKLLSFGGNRPYRKQATLYKESYHHSSLLGPRFILIIAYSLKSSRSCVFFVSSPPTRQLCDPGDLVCLAPNLYPHCLAQCLAHGKCFIKISQLNAVIVQSWAHFQVIATAAFSLSIHRGLISCGLNLQCCFQNLAIAKLCAREVAYI